MKNLNVERFLNFTHSFHRIISALSLLYMIQYNSTIDTLLSQIPPISELCRPPQASRLYPRQ